MKLNKKLQVLNGFIHDFSTGYWLASMITIFSLNNFQAQYRELDGQLNILERFFFWNTIASVVVIFATGGIRTFTYIDNFYGEDAEKTRRRMLIIKHVLMFLIFGAGGYLAYGMVF